MLPALVTQNDVTVYTEAARKYAAKSRSENTLRSYASAWKEFAQFAGDGAR